MTATAPLPAPSPHSDEAPDACRDRLRTDLVRCRRGTLALFDGLDDAGFRRSIDPAFSPVGWHLGHIAFTEALWLVRECGGRPLPFPELEETFHVEGLCKPDRSARIPGPDAVRTYVDAVRDMVLDCLEEVSFPARERLWRFVLQHECQHTETARFLMHLATRRDDPPDLSVAAFEGLDMVAIGGGAFGIGSDAAEAIDNERPRHQRPVATAAIGRTPVTQAQYAAFMADRGYLRVDLWTPSGWAWRTTEGIEGPLYWTPGAADHPVCGVSAHEAEAFARWAGARLPTEFEWEVAAAGAPVPGDDPDPAARLGTVPVGTASGPAPSGAVDLCGNVWEWTASPFSEYEGFVPWPYSGYSETYMDGVHRVLRGGSWATRPWAMRPTFRNWYVPETRQILAGFRCARDS